MRDPTLYNEDLAPVPLAKRTWGVYSYASLWVAMSVCIPTYMLASGLTGFHVHLIVGEPHPALERIRDAGGQR